MPPVRTYRPGSDPSGGPTFGYSEDTAPRPFVNYYGSSLISSESQGSVDRVNGTITVPAAGKYRITFSEHYMSSRANYYWAKTELQVNGISRRTPSTWGLSAGWGTNPT